MRRTGARPPILRRTPASRSSQRLQATGSPWGRTFALRARFDPHRSSRLRPASSKRASGTESRWGRIPLHIACFQNSLCFFEDGGIVGVEGLLAADILRAACAGRQVLPGLARRCRRTACQRRVCALTSSALPMWAFHSSIFLLSASRSADTSIGDMSRHRYSVTVLDGWQSASWDRPRDRAVTGCARTQAARVFLQASRRARIDARARHGP